MKHKMGNGMRITVIWSIFLVAFMFNCSETRVDPDDKSPVKGSAPEHFLFGVDLSYLNQILDHNGIYLDGGETGNPYDIFKDHGANLARFRIWHNPQWTKDIYGAEGTQMYNDLLDVEKAISASKAVGMKVLLDFHYSDFWADPGRQKIPEAWVDITSLDVLEDSVYNYTFKTLKYLNDRGLMPEFVQIGNEINCGMMFTEAPSAFPKCNVCEDNWSNLGKVINSGIKAARDVEQLSDVDTKIILHVADPKNVTWWFDNIINNGNVTDFEIVGFSYYPIWHSEIVIAALGVNVASFKSKYQKEVMVLETAYPWTPEGNDDYNNIFGPGQALTDYPFTPAGQSTILHDITQQVISGGGCGIIYWEPGWISSEMKDFWGTGSAWENCAFFDYSHNWHAGANFMNDSYE